MYHLLVTTMMIMMICLATTTQHTEQEIQNALQNGTTLDEILAPTTDPLFLKSMYFALLENVTFSTQLDVAIESTDVTRINAATTTTTSSSSSSSSTTVSDNNNNVRIDSISNVMVDQQRHTSSRLTAAATDDATTQNFTIPNHRQRISAVRVTPASIDHVGGAGGKGAVKNTKIELPAGLNYVFDTQNKHRHHDFRRYGPLFETGNVTNITVQAGNTFYLNCRISLLLDKTVSWVHRRMGQNELQLLTVGKQTYSGDPRFTIDFQYPNNWRLKIESVIKDDEGVYECQISTHPPRIITYHLHVNDPKILIVDEAGIPLLDKYVQVDSTIKLTCIVRHISMTSSVVYWLHGESILNHDTTRGGISVKTVLKNYGANSTLFVAKVNQSDSGNYTCSIGPNQHYTVMVHVLNESLAELHHSSNAKSLRVYHQQFHHQLILLALLTIVMYFSTTQPVLR